MSEQEHLTVSQNSSRTADDENQNTECDDVNDNKAECNSADITIETELRRDCSLVYKLTDTPPPYSIIFFALQQGLLAITTPLLTVFIIGEVICAGDDDEMKTQILSTTFLMIGLSTLAMVTIGVRLPIFQGPNFTYVLPILSMINLDEFQCPAMFEQKNPHTNQTTMMALLNNNSTIVNKRDFVEARISELNGSLIVIGIAHCVMGATGLLGFFAKFVGPNTIVPIVLLFGLQIHPVVVDFCQADWGTALLTACLALVLGLYLENYQTPIPVWTPSKGFFISWYPVHNVFALFISVVIGWIVCFFLTEFDVLPNDPTSKRYLARTDARFDVVHRTDWFTFPYPGQFGIPTFNLTAAITFFIATLMSMLDSIADYSASARIACAPQPPKFALNRGVAVEGLMIAISGVFGCGHGTVSFGENVGAMRLSRVVSRSVFQVCGLIYIVFAFIGKLGAFFITIPHSVMGGCQLITFGILVGVILSYLQYIDLNSTRNLSILGITLLLGFMMPYWVNNNPDAIDTGSVRGDSVIKVLLSNPSFVAGLIACLLDNTIPGTLEERGIIARLQEMEAGATLDSDPESPAYQTSKKDKKSSPLLLHGREVYRLPWLPDKIRNSAIARFLPIFDDKCDNSK